MEEKKLTNGQLERRLKNALLHIDKTSDTKSIYFDDKGLRLTATEDFAIIETSFHRHVFNSFTSQGVSRPWLYVRRFIEITLANDCVVKDKKGQITRSYSKLFSILDEKKDKAEYNVAWYIDLWLTNLFSPLYTIGETEAESFLVYETFLHNVARNKVIMSEKTQDVTNVDFINEVCDSELKMIEGIEKRVIFPKKTDEEMMQEEVGAMQEIQNDKTLKDAN